MNHELMRKVRIEQQLNKIARFSCGIMSYRDYFNKFIIGVEFIISDNMDKYNRVKFNRMDNNKDQDDYIAKLKEKVTKYRAYNKNGSFIDINKLLYEGYKSLKKEVK